MVEKQSEAFHTFLWPFFPSSKQNFIVYCSFNVSSRPDCIFAIHQLWQSGFSRMYSNSCYSCSFESEIIKIGQSSRKMYSNNTINLQESTSILDPCTKKVWKLIEGTTYVQFVSPQTVHTCMYMCTNSTAWAGCDTESYKHVCNISKSHTHF